MSDDSSLPSLQRRSVLKSLAAGGLLGGGTATLADVASADELVDPDDLGTWRILQNHETVDVSPEGDGTHPSEHISHRNTVSTVYGLSHVNTKVPDAQDDVYRDECGGQPGVQHRFVATTFSFGQRIHEWGPLGDGIDQRGGTTGIEAINSARMEVTAPDTGSGSNLDCGPVSLTLNNAYQGRSSLSGLTADGGQRATKMSPDEVARGTDNYFQNASPEVNHPSMPNREFPWREATKMALTVASLGIRSSLVGFVVAEWGIPGFLDTFYGSCHYSRSHELDRDRLLLKQDKVSCGNSKHNKQPGEAVFNFADFTVTVPPGTESQFEVLQDIQYRSISEESAAPGRIEDGSDPNEQMRNGRNWIVDVPSIDIGQSVDNLGPSDLPSPTRPTNGHRGGPSPSIEYETAEYGTTGTDGTASGAYQFRAVTDVDVGSDKTSLRWRIYRDQPDTIRPMIGYGESFDVNLNDRGNDEDGEGPFGPGDYVAELTVFDKQGRIGSTTEQFTFERADDSLPRAEFSLPDTVSPGKEIRLDGSDSVDIGSGPGTRASDRINLFVWEITFEDGSRELRYGRSSTYTFESPTECTVKLYVYTIEKGHGQLLRDKVTPDGRPDPSAARSPQNVWEIDFENAEGSNYVHSDTTSESLSVENAGPTAAFVYDIADGETGDTVTLDASMSTDEDGSIQSYEWTVTLPTSDSGWGGQVPLPGYGWGSDRVPDTKQFYGPTVETSFDEPGTYDVELTVTDDGGKTDTVTDSFELADGSLLDVSIGGAGANGGAPGDYLSLQASVAEDDHSELSWKWGTPAGADYESMDLSSDGSTATVSFDNPGTYTVEVEASGADGEYGYAEEQLEVKAPPDVTIEGDQQIDFDPNTGDEMYVEYGVSVAGQDDGEYRYSWSLDAEGFDFERRAERGATATLRFDRGSVDTTGTLTVRVTDDVGNTVSDSLGITVGDPAPPTVSINVHKNPVIAGVPVTIDADASDSDGSISSYTWSGDVSGSGREISATFDESGEYDVTVEVTDSDGLTATASTTATVVENRPPKITSLTGVWNPDPGQRTGYSVEATDPDGDDDALDYQWTADGDLGSFSGTDTPSISGKFDGTGEKTITVEVTDEGGESVSKSRTVDVGSTPGDGTDELSVTASCSEDSVKTGETVTFSADVSNTGGASVSYEWSGAVEGDSSSVSTSFDSTGSKTATVTVTVTDGTGETATASASTTVVGNRPPEITSLNGPTEVDVGQRASYSVEATDPDGDALAYKWSGAVSGTGQSVFTKFNGAGSQTVGVTVSDEGGKSTSRSLTVDVGSTSGGGGGGLSVTASCSEDSVKTGETVTFSADVSNTGGASVSYEWSGAVQGSGSSVSTTFDSAGSKTATVTVTDSAGRKASDDVNVQVGDDEDDGPVDIAPPKARLDVPETIANGKPVTLDASSSSDNLGIDKYRFWPGQDQGAIESKSPTVEHTYNYEPDELPVETEVKLKVWDQAHSDTARQDVTIVEPNESPTVSIDAPAVTHTKSVTLDGSGSSDPDGEIVSYEWRISTPEGERLNATGPTPSVELRSEGLYYVVLEVTDDRGASTERLHELEFDSNRAPVIENIRSANRWPVDKQVGFGVEATDPDGEIVSYEWSGDVSGSGDSITTVFSTPGERTVRVTVTDDGGRTATESTTITIHGNEPPTVSASAPDTADVNEEVTFTADGTDADGDDLSYKWTGAVEGSGRTRSKAFSSPGTKEATVTVTDEHGATATASARVEVTDNEGPTITSLNGPTEVEVGQQVGYSVEATDPEGDALSYRWSDAISDTGQSVLTKFDGAGERTVTVTATDTAGNTDRASKTVTVSETPPPPPVSIEGPATVEPGQQVSYDAVVEGYPNPEELTYRWSGAVSGSGQSITTAFDGGGERTITLTVANPEGASTSASKTIEVDGNGPPKITSLNGPTEVEVGQRAAYSVEATDPDGDALSYKWSGAISDTGQSVFTKFNGAGKKTVEVVVSDSAGNTDKASKTISVNENNPPNVVTIRGPDEAQVGDSPTYTVEASDPDGSIDSYEWSMVGRSLDGDKTGKSVTPTFEKPGTPTLRVVVTDDDGATTGVTKTIEVSEAPNKPPKITEIDSRQDNYKVGDQVTFAVQANDPDGEIVDHQWSLVGRSLDEDGTRPYVQHTFDSPGEATLRVVVTDDDGATTGATKTIDVAPRTTNQNPDIRAIEGPDSVAVGEQVTYTADAVDPDGSIADYQWSLKNRSLNADGSGDSVSLTFDSPGSASLRVEVTDNDGGKLVDYKSITVTSQSQKPTAKIDGPSVVANGGTAEFSASGSSDPDGEITSYEWRTSRGTVGTGPRVSIQARKGVNRDYPEKVTLKVTDDDGNVDETSQSVSVLQRRDDR